MSLTCHHTWAAGLAQDEEEAGPEQRGRVKEGVVCVQGKCHPGSYGDLSFYYYLHIETFYFLQAEAIFNHMGPNMARGWMADSAGTRVRFEDGPVDNRTSQVLKVR